jgi:hypothetical protein
MVGNLSYFAKKELHPKIFVQFSFKLVKLVLSNLNAFWSSKSRKESDMDLLMVNSAINLVEAWKEGQAKRKKNPADCESQSAITSYYKKLITVVCHFKAVHFKAGF